MPQLSQEAEDERVAERQWRKNQATLVIRAAFLCLAGNIVKPSALFEALVKANIKDL